MGSTHSLHLKLQSLSEVEAGGIPRVAVKSRFPKGLSGAGSARKPPMAGSTWAGRSRTANSGSTSPCPRASRPRRSHPPAPAGGGSTAAGWPRNRPGRRSQAAATGWSSASPRKTKGNDRKSHARTKTSRRYEKPPPSHKRILKTAFAYDAMNRHRNFPVAHRIGPPTRNIRFNRTPNKPIIL